MIIVNRNSKKKTLMSYFGNSCVFMELSCEHAKTRKKHICSNFDKYYCVLCLWKHTSGMKHVTLDIDKVDSIDDIEWEGEKAIDIMKKGCGEHYKRIIDGDTSFPIIIKEYRKGYLILDGCHRYVKLLMILNEKKVNCIIVAEDILKKCELVNK